MERRPARASGSDEPVDPAVQLREAGLVSTLPRRALWRALSRSTRHPTADELFDSVGGMASGISRATVYRTLEAFVAAGLAQRVGHPGISVRYDPRTSHHHHLVCERCGEMRDIEPGRLAPGEELESLGRRMKSLDGFQVHELSVLIRGRCAACQ